MRGPVARNSSVPFSVDDAVPALIVKFGDYPLHHGGVGAIRSLGRLGVPMYAITEDPYTPAASSRCLRRAFVWPTTGTEEPDRLVEGLLRIGKRIGRAAVLVPTDEEAAVLIAERQKELGGVFLFPRVEAGLPRRLASKQGLHELCVEHGIPTPPGGEHRPACSPRLPTQRLYDAARADPGERDGAGLARG